MFWDISQSGRNSSFALGWEFEHIHGYNGMSFCIFKIQLDFDAWNQRRQRLSPRDVLYSAIYKRNTVMIHII